MLTGIWPTSATGNKLPRRNSSWPTTNNAVAEPRTPELRRNVDEHTCRIWTDLGICCIDSAETLACQSSDAGEPSDSRTLQLQLDDYRANYQYFFEKEDVASAIRKVAPEQFRATRSLIQANLQSCERNLQNADYCSAADRLETIVRGYRDLMGAMSFALTE